MRTLNLGILAHVDAGKTTLTERLLFTAGAIDHVGSVDAGTTQTDSLELERERGITIRSAVASFLVGDLAVNLVDTPGHPDFIAEVERVLGVLDGAVLVVSAVEGVQPQTPLLFRALQRLRVPTLIFVNKIDRAGADPERVVAAMRRRLVAGGRPDGPGRGRRRPRRRAFVPVQRGRRRAPSRPGRGPRRARRGDPARVRARTRSRCRTRASASSSPSQTRAGRRPPGVLRLGGTRHRDRRAARRRRRAPVGRAAAIRTREVSGRVFKIERTASGERVAYVRLFAGTLRPRQRVRVGGGEEAKPTSIKVFAPAGAPRRDVAHCRARWRRPRARRGPGRRRDRRRRRRASEATARFPRPALEAVVFAAAPGPAGLAPRGAGPARRAGPAHRRPPGRPPPRDRGLALRRGPEGGHPGDARARLRHRRRLPRDDRRVHRAARAGRRGRGGHPRQDEDEHHRPELAAEHEPVQGDARPSGSSRCRSARGSSSVPTSSRGSSRSTCSRRRRCSRARWRLTSTRRSREGLAGWQVTDCRVTMTDCGYASPDTTRGRLPAPDPARPDDRARSGRDVGVRAARRPRARDAGVDGAGRARDRSAGSAAGSRASSRRTASRRSARCCRSRASAHCSTSCRACRWGRASSSSGPAATSRSARTRHDAHARARARSTATPGSPRWPRAAPRRNVAATGATLQVGCGPRIRCTHEHDDGCHHPSRRCMSWMSSTG